MVGTTGFLHHDHCDGSDDRRNSHSWMDALLTDYDLFDEHAVDDVPSSFTKVEPQAKCDTATLPMNETASASVSAPVSVAPSSTSESETEDWQDEDFDFDIHVEAHHSPRQSTPSPLTVTSMPPPATNASVGLASSNPSTVNVVSPDTQSFTIGVPAMNNSYSSTRTTNMINNQVQTQEQAMQMMHTLALPFSSQRQNNFGAMIQGSSMMTNAAPCSFQRVVSTSVPTSAARVSFSSAFDASMVPLIGKSMGSDYVDYSDVPEQDQTIPPAERNTGGVQRPFPERLHDMLTENKSPDVVSWAPHGRCFVVRQPRCFETKVLPNYFNQTKYRSFQRQLNLYGFRRITGGPDRGGYYHPLMLRGRRKLCTRMRRLKPMSKGGKGNPFTTNALVDPALEPNFYAMTPVGDYSEVSTGASYSSQAHNMFYGRSTQSAAAVGNVNLPMQQQQSSVMALNLSSASPLTAALYNR